MPPHRCARQHCPCVSTSSPTFVLAGQSIAPSYLIHAALDCPSALAAAPFPGYMPVCCCGVFAFSSSPPHSGSASARGRFVLSASAVSISSSSTHPLLFARGSCLLSNVLSSLVVVLVPRLPLSSDCTRFSSFFSNPPLSLRAHDPPITSHNTDIRFSLNQHRHPTGLSSIS
eukprot:m.26571 g.26571  ORF g.26571 m.26571 type:complete len:172 (+) comp4616_c0_seq1:1506-2021(+)